MILLPAPALSTGLFVGTVTNGGFLQDGGQRRALTSLRMTTEARHQSSTSITQDFGFGQWETVETAEFPGGSVTYERAVYTYDGRLQGTGTVRYLMLYGTGPVQVTGVETIEGSVDGRAGSFVISHTGTATPDSVDGTFEVVAGSGTSALSGLSGSGTIRVRNGTPTMSFTYTLG